MMWQSLLKLRALPDDTAVFCGHEYTAGEYPLRADHRAGQRGAARAREKTVDAAPRGRSKPTIPSTMGEEKAANPFLRADLPEVAARSAWPASRRRRCSPKSASARTSSSSGPDESAPISPLSFRDGLKGRARNPYSQPVVMDSGLAPPKSAVADLGTIDCRSRVNPRSVARPGMTRMVQYQRNAL